MLIQASRAGWQGLPAVAAAAAVEGSVAALEPGPWSGCREGHAHLQPVWMWPLHPQIQQEPNNTQVIHKINVVPHPVSSQVLGSYMYMYNHSEVFQ